jgi:hypothetical protein
MRQWRSLTWVFVFVDYHDAAIGKNHLDFDEIIDTQAVQPTQEAEAT